MFSTTSCGRKCISQRIPILLYYYDPEVVKPTHRVFEVESKKHNTWLIVCSYRENRFYFLLRTQIMDRIKISVWIRTLQHWMHFIFLCPSASIQLRLNALQTQVKPPMWGCLEFWCLHPPVHLLYQEKGIIYHALHSGCRNPCKCGQVMAPVRNLKLYPLCCYGAPTPISPHVLLALGCYAN